MTTMTTALPIITADPTLSSPINANTLPPVHPYSSTDLEAAVRPTNHTNHTSTTNPPNPTTTTTAPPTNRTSTSTTTSSPSIPWGPTHPCYPHPNPHLPLSSPLCTKTRILRIPRDWMLAADLAPQYSNIYPETLEPWVSESDFRSLISHINAQLLIAFGADSLTITPNPNHNTTAGEKRGKIGLGNHKTWLDALLGLLTGWIWEDLGGELLE
ncbi:hypothetical protein Q9189_006641, partial [Teloschistes chrysophthalmus]